MLIVDKQCYDEFSVPQIDRKSKQVKEQCHEKFYLQSVWGKACYIKHRKYQNLWMNNKVRVLKIQFVCILPNSFICMTEGFLCEINQYDEVWLELGMHIPRNRRNVNFWYIIDPKVLQTGVFWQIRG